MLGKFYSRINRTNQTVLDDTGYSYGAAKLSKVGLHRRCDRVGRHLKRRQWGLRGDFLVARTTLSAPLINSRISHWRHNNPLAKHNQGKGIRNSQDRRLYRS